jgi:hypothetical protein
MSNINSSHNKGLVFGNQKQPQNPEQPRKALLPVIVLLAFLSLGGLGFYSVFKGGSVVLQVREFILTFSGQAQPK